MPRWARCTPGRAAGVPGDLPARCAGRGCRQRAVSMHACRSKAGIPVHPNHVPPRDLAIGGPDDERDAGKPVHGDVIVHRGLGRVQVRDPATCPGEVRFVLHGLDRIDDRFASRRERGREPAYLLGNFLLGKGRSIDPLLGKEGIKRVWPHANAI